MSTKHVSLTLRKNMCLKTKHSKISGSKGDEVIEKFTILYNEGLCDVKI
jgi:hypothetical protein